MISTRRLLIGAAAIALPCPAAAAPACAFDVAPGPLGGVAAAIGQCAGITVTVPDPALASRASPGVRGRMTLRVAIARALRGTGGEARYPSIDVVRIVPARADAPRPPRPAPSPSPAPVPDESGPDIVVTATKQDLRLSDYPGSAKVVNLDRAWVGRNAAEGTAAITRTLPAIQATDLGQGRDKLFVRGIADSSFRGQTQAATGQYLGDVRLTFNAPDPSLNLYDMQRVEVLVGPQAPLYGAGSLGGVIRLVPNAPVTTAASGTASANVATTRFGGIGHDEAAMVNLPIVAGRLAARVVAFDAVRAGYIDAPAQGRRDINRTRSRGYRAMLRFATAGAWTIDAGDVRQDLHSADGQYATRGAPALTRDVPVPEPFGSRYKLRYITASRDIGTSQVVTTTGRVDHHLSSVFDAGAVFGPNARFDEVNDIGIWSHETRWSGHSGDTRWLAGISAVHSVSDDRAALRTATENSAIAFENRNFDAALFGSYTRPIARDLILTAGGRLSFAVTEGLLKQVRGGARLSRQNLRFSRLLALDWQPPGDWSAYLRHEQGYRAGGLNVLLAADAVFSRNYRPDTLALYEVGARFGTPGTGHVTARAALFRADWSNVQADVATIFGITVTDNVGNGRVVGFDTELLWTGPGGWSLKGDLFVNDGRLGTVGGSAVPLDARRLPSIAGAGARVAGGWSGEVRGAATRADAALRYVGASRLGVGEQLNIPQGDYLVVDAGASIDLGRFTLALKLDNLLDRRANTFAFGNPFSVSRRDQITPLRPRTLTLGVDARF